MFTENTGEEFCFHIILSIQNYETYSLKNLPFLGSIAFDETSAAWVCKEMNLEAWLIDMILGKSFVNSIV